MQDPPELDPFERPSTARALGLWAVYALALGPVFVDAASHLQAHPWARYAPLFPLLFLRSALREPEPAPPRRDGWFLVAAGLPLLAYGAIMATLRVGRLPAALAALGLCRSLGIGSTRSQILLLFSVPLPGSIAIQAAPWLPQTLLAWAECLLTASGFEVSPH